MPYPILTDAISLEFEAQEPWPDDVKLYQPHEVEQILLPDNASCLAVQAFLKMCGLRYEVIMKWNAEFMSPSGRVPFIRCGAFVVPELEPIVQFCSNKGATLTSQLSQDQRADMRAFMSTVNNVLVNAELYVTWLDEETYAKVTCPRNGSVFPWPLCWLQNRSKKAAVTKRLRALNWANKSLEDVLSEVERCCQALSERLGDKDYFFGSPTELDALVFGHVFTIVTTPLPCSRLAEIVKSSTELVSLAKRIEDTYFKRKP